jgi:KDO2-lipid IV(A) lauroyltransferase
VISRYRWIRLVAPVAGRFPAVFYPVAAMVAWVAWHSRPAMRRALVQNMLPLCDGVKRRAEREARRACGNIARSWLDIATVPYRDFTTFERDHITFEHAERLELLNRPGPVLIVSAHSGGAELVLQAMIPRGRRFIALVEDIEPPELSAYLNRLRSAAGGCFKPANVAGARAAFAALRRGEVLGIMADRDIQETGICVVVAGNPVKLPRGPWEIARRTGATILPMFARRDWRDRFTVAVEEPFHVACLGDEALAVREAATRFASLLEAHLRREPGQWTVVEDFWSVHRCGES